ncbi:uncharacterized protein LOC131536081 isoform X5 [Onychostoma macrolepis]|uniref:uncharacterized protein LOC131536081 isoform X5 n=1 Tax=Onychostoma macrolepis TaxID=369639 RepID=UPI00272D2004|nr:uncharacterized protein LOC131536081 isoform X5 [Onychostoma macrolepis]
MACAQQSAKEYLRNTRKKLVTGLKNLPLIVENLYQKKVFSVYEVDALKAESAEFDKARCILDWVINKGDEASYEFLQILDVTKKRTLDPGLHPWISCSPFRDDDAEPSYSFGTKPCQIYQTRLKMKARSILKNQRKCFCKYLEDEVQGNFSFIPLVLKTDSVIKTLCKIKLKSKKCKKLRPKKLRAYIPNEGQTLSPEGLLRWQDKNILIIGKPGVGKTTVVQEMLRLWAEKDGRQIDYMFYFDESVLAHNSVASLEALLFDVYSKPLDEDRKEVFQDLEENSENVVIVFDGVTDLKEGSVLWKIMDHDLLPDAKIVITCRSEEEDDPLLSDWPTRTVYVQGFSEESIKTYYQRMLGHDPVLLEVILKNQELFSLSHVPMYASMVTAFISFKNYTKNKHPHTVTEMYIHIFRLAVKKHGNKQNKQIDNYLKEKKDQILQLMENTFNATKQKCLNLSDINSDETDICHAFLKMITTTDSPTSAATYCAFLHNTMQEFFSALWLLGHPDEIEDVLQLCQTEEHKHMRHVLPFLCGLLSERNTRLIKCLFPEDQIKKTSDWFSEKLLDVFLQPQSESEEFDLLYVCQCLYELQSPKACLMFLEKMNHQLDLEVDLDPHQCCALSYVIGQSRDKEVYLNLEDCNVTDVGMNMMLSCSPNIRLKTCEDPLKQITFFVEFFHKSSRCDCKLIDMRERYDPEKCSALLDLCSHVKNYETQTGRSYLPALQSVFQSPDVWIIDLSERKISVLLEVLKLQTEKKPVDLRRCSEEEREVMSFLQCLPYISQLRFSDQSESVISRFLLSLFIKAAEIETQTGEQILKVLMSVCTSSSDYGWIHIIYGSDFLLDLCSHVKNYETQTGRSYLPALQSVFQSRDVWIIDLSERKSSVLLEVLKLQTEKKPVELRRCSEEEVMSFLQCLPYISQLRFWNISNKEERMSSVRLLLNLCVAAEETDKDTGTRFSTLLSSVCSYKTFPFVNNDHDPSDFLLDLCSHVKNYETQTGRSYLPALQSVFQSPDVWIIDLSERKISVLLEVLKLQTEKKPVDLRRCSEEEREVMSFLQCLPYISQLRFWYTDDDDEERMSSVRLLLNLCVAAEETDKDTGTRFSTLLSSVCSYKTFPFDEEIGYYADNQSDFLLDLCSHVKNYETQTGRSYLPALQSVFQSPDVWIIDLSERKISVLLEVLKLQTEKKPVELRRCSEEEREVMSFLQCLPYISQLRIWNISNKETRKSSVRLLLNLCVAAEETDKYTGTRFSTLLSSVCSYKTFPFDEEIGYYADDQSDFLLDLCSHVKNYETQTGRSYFPALQSVFQSPDVWIIDLSERKISVLLEVLKLQTEKKPVELRRCSEEEREVMSFLQCLPYISQLRFWNISNKETRKSSVRLLLNLCVAAEETDKDTGTRFSTLLSSVCSYKTFPFDEEFGYYADDQSDFLLDLCSHVKNYETQTGRSYFPALQSVFQSPDVWIIDLSERKSSVLLEVLKLQTEKKPVELRRCSEEEREVKSLLQCLPYISQLRFWDIGSNEETRMSSVRLLLNLCLAAEETDKDTGTRFLTLLSSVCSYKTFFFDDDDDDDDDQSDFLLDLCSHVKNYETQTGRSYLPALQSVFQSPDEWIIDLSERKISVLLEVLKLQTEKKPVKLRIYSEEEREVMSFLQCLPYISQLRFWNISNKEERMSSVRLLLNLCVAAEETDKDTGTRFSTLLSSVCSYKTFPFNYNRHNQSDFLLDLYSHVKNYETQTGRSYLPALQSVFQSPDVWIIDLSERKISVLLEVLKLQTEKKTVDLRRCSEEEREVMSFLQCLPYISQLRIWNISNKETRMSSVRLLLNLCVAAEETDKDTGTRFSTLLSSVCSYKTFPFDYNPHNQSDFLLDLCSHVKNYETQTGRSYLPALQSVFQSPDEWIIDLSERKISVLLEVLKLQTEKKPVELRRCSEEEREVMSFLQCLPYISQLRFWNVSNKETRMSSVRLLLNLCVAAEETDKDTGTRFSTLLSSVCSYKTFPFNKDGHVQIDFLLDLCSHVKNYETQTGRRYLPALQSVFQSPDVWIIDLSERKISVLLEVLKLQTEKKPVDLRRCSEEEREVKSLLQCLPYISQLRLSKETLQKLVECVYEAQEEELTECFLQIVDGDLTSCSLSWEELHYFLQHRIQQITVDFRKSNIQCRISEILPFLNRVQFKRMSSAFMLCVMTEIYESGSAGFVFSLLSSVKNYINLQSRDLDSVHCAALRFTLQHCTAASLNLLWTSIPEEELESILPLFTHLSRLSVDRLLLLKMLHCCSVSDVQQEAAAVLLSVLQHKLDFSCRSALDLTTNTDSEPLHLTADDCRVMSRVIQRAHSDTKTQLILQDCEIHTAGMDQMFPVLHSVQLCCDKPLLLQFLAHVRPEEAQSLSGALGEELDLSQTQLDLQVCRGLELILEYSEGLTELDLSQCRLIDHSLDLLLPNLHKVQNIDFSGNSITDAGAQKIYSIVTLNSNIKTVRLFNNRIESRELFRTDPDLRSGDKLSLESTNS